MTKTADVSKPITLEVEKINAQTNITYYQKRRRGTVIDLQITPQHAVQLIEYLRERNCQGLEGKIPVRLMGRLKVS